MSQNPGGNPGQQPWDGAPSSGPRPEPGPQAPVGGQGTQPGYPTPPGYSQQPGYTQPGYAQQPGYTQQPGYQPGYSQQGYAQQPGYTQTGYPGQAGYGARPGYPQQPQQYPSQPPYGQPQQFAAVPYQPVPAAGPGSPLVGFLALGVVVLATIASLFGGWLMLQEMQPFLTSAIYSGSTDSEAIQRAIAGSATWISVSATVGFAGWVAGIVAAATNRGRTAGILAIVIGVIAPFLIWGYVGLSIASMLQQYR